MSTTTNLPTLKINYLTQAQYDAAVSGGTVNADELYFTPSVDYSTSEVNTGKKWIDGKTIYCKTIEVPNVAADISTNRATYSSELSITDVDELINAFGFAKLYDGNYTNRRYHIPCLGNMGTSCTVQVGGGFLQTGTGRVLVNFYIDNSSGYASSKVTFLVTVFYTKT